MTPEQKKIQREYDRMQKVIDGASRGQQMMRPQTLPDGSRGYSEQQQSFYAQYQDKIERAMKRQQELRDQAKASTA